MSMLLKVQLEFSSCWVFSGSMETEHMHTDSFDTSHFALCLHVPSVQESRKPRVFNLHRFEVKRITDTVQGVTQLGQSHAVGVGLEMDILHLNPFMSCDLHGVGWVCVGNV